MASCIRCGKAKLKRDKHGRRKCGRCGVMPSNRRLDQGGNPRPIECEEVRNDKTAQAQ
jgi:transcription initiation factor TFIIIB Brf1 subunit/transcription initiation factor TFIIB